jgi:hypothetical protein
LRRATGTRRAGNGAGVRRIIRWRLSAGEPAMPRPIHFEINAADPQRAIAFYAALFGWGFSKDTEGNIFGVMQMDEAAK